MTYTRQLSEQIRQRHGQWMLGHDDVLDLLLTAFFARGHVLIEGPPGTGKTMMVKIIARLLSRSFKRVQFTSDMLPADILGANVFLPDQRDFKFIPGPIFTDILLADEINRTPPRTQSALLEGMEEKQVTIDGQEYRLSPDFFVLATQNPQDHEGTFLLPEVQLDRFLFKLVLDHAAFEVETRILESVLQGKIPPAFEELTPLSFERSRVDEEIASVKVDRSLIDTVAKLLRLTRESPLLAYGSSVRGGISIVRCARIRALLEGRDFVAADDIKALAVPALRHRIRLNPEAEVAQVSETEFLESLLKQIEFPE